MATTVKIRNRRTARPGAYGVIDGSALSRREPGIRRLLLIGTAEGGIPVSERTDGAPTFLGATNPGGVRALFRAGDLRTAGLLAFQASADPEIGAPSAVLFAKINPARPARLTMANPHGPALALETVGWGEFANLTRFTLGLGTTQGYSIEIAQGDDIEQGNNIGGDPAMTVLAKDPGWRRDNHLLLDSARLAISGAGAQVIFGLEASGDYRLAPHVSGQVVKVSSTSANDTVQDVTVYGTTAAGAPVSETLRLAGTLERVGIVVFGVVTGARVNAATLGTVAVKSTSMTGSSIYEIAPTLVAGHGPNAEIEVLSSSAVDAGTIVVSGIAPGGLPLVETIQIAGTTPVAGARSFLRIFSARLLAEQIGSITVRSRAGGGEAFTIPAGERTAGVGIGRGIAYPVDPTAFRGPRTVESDVDGIVILRGADTTGDTVAEKLVFTTGGGTASTATFWTRIDQVEVGEVDTNVIIRGVAVDCPIATYPSVGHVGAAMGSREQLTATVLVDAAATFGVERLDPLDASILATASVYADLDALVQWVNSNSQLVTAAAPPGAVGAPDLGGPFNFSGGTEGVATAAHWQAAIDAAQRLRDIVIVPISEDASVHAMLTAHMRHMEGAGNSEREGVVGLGLISKSQIKQAIKIINDRNTAVVAQGANVFGEDGRQVARETKFLAAMVGSMQASAEPGLPLTRKRPNVISVTQHATWDPYDDADEMIQAGLLVVEIDDVVGPRILRDVTSWRNDDNPIFTAVGANGSANGSMRRLRAQLDLAVGDRAFDGQAATLRSVAAAELDQQVTDGLIKAWNPASLSVADLGDTFLAEAEIAPMEGVVFVVSTLNLRRIAR